MEISEDTRDRLRTTWAASVAVPDVFAQLFYGRLFASDPELRVLFKSDMEAQGRKLVDTVSFVVDHLDEDDVLLPAARDLAIRHVSYGVLPEHYRLVGAALVGTLEELLGSIFAPQDIAAWTDVYAGLSDHMIASAYGS